MKATGVALAGRTALAVTVCAVLAACGTVRQGEAAGPAPVPTLSPEICDLDRTTGGGSGTGAATPYIPTEEQTGGYAGPPTDQDDGIPDPPTDQDDGIPDPPTDGETGGYAGPPTDQDSGTPGPPTDQDTGVPDPPTDHDSGTPGPPTDGGAAPGAVTNGAGPCGAAGWFDMTKDFVGYWAKHRADYDDIPLNGIAQVRVRKVRGTGVAEVSFTAKGVGKGRGDDARRVVEVFAAWRHDVYGDKGTVTVRTREEYPVVVGGSW